ncbi:MAG: rhodanese-like domain-containing protein, partial [Mameliella sp.]|nr:rhodanese-like domain-containing protein [Phaeodactylibacter sp.]
EVTDGLVAPPQYFPKNAVMNKMGYDSIDDILGKGLNPLTIRAFKAAWAEEEVLVIDTRHQDEFVKGFIPGAIFIGIDDNFAMWVGALITDLQVPILFVADEGREKEIVTRLARVGYDNPIGYLEGGYDAWKDAGEEVDTLEDITAGALVRLMDKEQLSVLDVRKASEYDAQHIVAAQNFPLDFINANMSEVSRDKRYFIHCAGGYRSVIAASILKSRGYHNLVNIKGGFKALVETDLPMTEFEEQITEL